MRITDLFIYPLKSTRGIALESSEIDAFGLPGDRRAMITDRDGHFITQRELPDLARIGVQAGPSQLHLSMGDKQMVALIPMAAKRMDVSIWKSIVNAAVADDASNHQLSEWLGRDVKLVFFDQDAKRSASAEWAGEGTPVTFADGYQILVTTTGSLRALNADWRHTAKAASAWSGSGPISWSIRKRLGRRTVGRRSKSAAFVLIWSNPVRVAS